MVKAKVFPGIMYGCESWTVKKAERRRTDVFKLWCWRILLRVPWKARKSNQSILEEINPETPRYIRRTDAETEAPINSNSLEKTLMQERLKEERDGATDDEMFG